ncbi:MAG TPA: LptF/LptG family permease [bacterium]|nr:LptF/LptG family permease [bacterium]
MKLVDKYLVKHFLTPFLYCVMAFFMISIVYDISVNLDTFISKKIGFGLLIEYYLLLMPVIAVNTMPIAALMAVLYELGNFQRFNEIIAFRASGISNARIIAPLLACGVAISAFSFTIGEFFVPQSLYKLNIIETQRLKKESKESLTKIIAFYNISQKRSWVGTIDLSSDKMYDFEVREFDPNGHVIRKISARELVYDENAKTWSFKNGKIFVYSPDPSETQEIDKRDFETMSFDYAETPELLINSQKDPMYMSAFELRAHIKTHPKHSKIYVEEKVDLYYKYAGPFVSFIVMLTGVAFGLRTTRGGLLIGVGTCVAIFIAYYGLSIVSLAMGKQEFIPALLAAWLPNLFFTALGATFLAKVNN